MKHKNQRDEKEMYKLEIEALVDKYKGLFRKITYDAKDDSKDDSKDDLTTVQHVFLTILFFYGFMAVVIFMQLTT